MDGASLSSVFALQHAMTKALDYSLHPQLAFQAIGFADVRYGILPSQSRLRGNDDNGGSSKRCGSTH